MRKLTLALLGALLLAAPDPARADWFVSPFVSGNVSGDATHRNPAVGVAGGWMGGGWLGVEGDFAWAPQFFEQNGFLTERKVTTLMGNVIIGIPGGKHESFQPYVSGGLGIIRPELSEPGGLFVLTDKNKLGANIGGGATAFLNRNVGIRGEIRYFRALRQEDSDANTFNLDLSKFHFWRGSAGLVVRF